MARDTQIKVTTGNVDSLYHQMGKVTVRRRFPSLSVTFGANEQIAEITSQFTGENFAVGTGQFRDVTGNYVVANRAAPIDMNDTVVNTTDDTYGHPLNAVLLLDNVTRDAVLDANGRQVFALLHGTMQDGETEADGSVYLTSVVYAADGTITPTTLDAASTKTVLTGLPVAETERNRPTWIAASGLIETDVIGGGGATKSITGTNSTDHRALSGEPLASNLITFSSGPDAMTSTHGTWTISNNQSWAGFSFGASAAEFNGNNSIIIKLNGQELVKGVDVTYNSSTSFTVNIMLLGENILEVLIG